MWENSSSSHSTSPTGGHRLSISSLSTTADDVFRDNSGLSSRSISSNESTSTVGATSDTNPLLKSHMGINLPHPNTNHNSNNHSNTSTNNNTNNSNTNHNSNNHSNTNTNNNTNISNSNNNNNRITTTNPNPNNNPIITNNSNTNNNSSNINVNTSSTANSNANHNHNHNHNVNTLTPHIIRNVLIPNIPIPGNESNTTLITATRSVISDSKLRSMSLPGQGGTGHVCRHPSTSSEKSEPDVTPKVDSTKLQQQKQHFIDWEKKCRGHHWIAWKTKLESEISHNDSKRALTTVKEGNSSPWSKFTLLAYLHTLLDANHETVPTDIHFVGCLVIVEGKPRYNAKRVEEEIERIKNAISDEELTMVYQDPMPRLTADTITNPLYLMDFRHRFRCNPTTAIDKAHLHARFGRYRIQNHQAAKILP